MEQIRYRRNGIPQEAQLLIADFLAQEAAQKIEVSSKRPKLLRTNGRTVPMTARQIERLARSKGLAVSTGNGRHGKHVEALCCGSSNPLPDHGGRAVSFGVQRTIEQFIERHQECAA